MDKYKDKKFDSKEVVTFEKELSRLPKSSQEIILQKEKKFSKLIQKIKEKGRNKVMGFYLSFEIDKTGPMPKPNLDKLTVHYLHDDFDKPFQAFDPKLFFGEDFLELLEEHKTKDEKNQDVFEYTLKEDSSIKFEGTSISLMRENCFDSNYDDLKALGNSLVYLDERGFISALKTIDIHRNMLLQKFERYVVVYAGAGSWLRGEKSNDFDVFVVIDDTDVKKMPRLQVKDQLTKIIWQMSREVAQMTGIQVHIQVYLLTDFWDALKDAHPVMFTFLRDGVPFYDRGLYSAWKELLKLGKIKPSPEAVDMHMNVGTQLVDRAKKTLNDIVMNDIYYAVLNPSQAILMLKGYNPTTPKETVKMFKEVLLEKEKSITEKDFKILEHSVKMFKEIEHKKDTKVSGKDVDKMLTDAESYLKKMKDMFEKISEEKIKDSIMTTYNELLNQIRQLPGYTELDETKLIREFKKDYIVSKKLPSFVKDSFDGVIKAKKDYDKGSITTTEVNKAIKEMRNILAEIKEFRDKILLSEANRRKVTLTYNGTGSAEIIDYDSKVYLQDFSNNKLYILEGKEFNELKDNEVSFLDNTKLSHVEINENLIKLVKKVLKAKSLTL